MGGGTSSPKSEDAEERAEDCRWKKRAEATSEEPGEDERVVVLGRGFALPFVFVFVFEFGFVEFVFVLAFVG